MRNQFVLALLLLPLSTRFTMADAAAPIDRHALVFRHNIDWPDLKGQIPLGNGNFAFNADGTGLETVGGNMMCHWCWHSFPLPPGVSQDDIKPWATPDHGHLNKNGNTTKPPQAIYDWQRLNPQPLNLGRIGFTDALGLRLRSSEMKVEKRHLDLWSGLLSSRFTNQGQAVDVETCVAPQSDTVAVHVASPLLSDGRLRILLDFPAPTHGEDRNWTWAGDFARESDHQTKVLHLTDGLLELDRIIDDAHYQVVLSGSGFSVEPAPASKLEIVSAQCRGKGVPWVDVTSKVSSLVTADGIEVTASNVVPENLAQNPEKEVRITYRLDGTEQNTSVVGGTSWSVSTHPSPHRFLITAKPGNSTINLTCHFGPKAVADPASTVVESQQACASWWPAFWKSGGAIDLSGSKDSRWMELERRIVLSQYEQAVHSAGDYPPAEVGLVGTDPWRAKWHFEMIWWHLAHYYLWDRSSMADKALSIYQKITPVAAAIAQNFDYKGLMWPKSTGPNGYNDGFPMEMSLLWKEPHPIFFAELDYRQHPTPSTLAKWKDIVFGTAEFMADYPTLNPANGQYDLAPVTNAAESATPHHINTVFELGYWRVGLEMAQQWRLRLGLSRDEHWDAVMSHLAPLPVLNGLYVYAFDRPDTFVKRMVDHLDIIGIAGMLPPFPGLDPAIARRTVKEVAGNWQWERLWGWDFPWLAMAAARVGEPQLAIEALLNPAKKNHFDEMGLCIGGTGVYLPSNGGLLYAVAMMAAGWDGAPNRHAPGFPDDGSWTVRWEDLKKAP